MSDKSTTSRATRILGAGLALLSAVSAVGLSSGPGPGLFHSLGFLLTATFAWAAVFIPLWLAGAALLAFVPGWRPAAIVALLGSLFPFLPLAAIARLSTGSESFLSDRPYLYALGAPALMALCLALALALTTFVFYITRSVSRLTSRPDPAQPRRSLLIPRRGSEEDSSTFEEGAFDFRVPVLPALPFLGAIDEVQEVPSESLVLPDIAAQPEEIEHIEIVPQPEGEAEGRIASAPPTALRGTAQTAAASVAAGKQAAAPTAAGQGSEAQAEVLKLDGKHSIEFISVPASHSPAEEAAAAAALKRILSRRKDKPYAVPSDGILTAYPDGEYWIVDEKTKQSAVVLRDTLAEFKIEAEVTGIRKGPVITMFEILPAPGVKLSKITNLADNIALRLAASSVRIVAPIPGKHAVGIEVPNERRSIVSLREIVENEQFKTAKMEIPIILGKDIAGEAQFIDLTQTPHLLIAGATGSGKSVSVNSIILSILYRRSPLEVRLLLIDPKIVELKLYNGIGHLLTPVITEPKRAFQALQYCICEMERRYSLLDHVGVRDVKSYNRKVKEKGLAAERLPYIVVIIDEFADLMATTGKELESTLARLAAMSRAVGIHLVLATQRPSIDVITGLIKANIPSRIAFMVASKFDSRIIIDMVGAEKLLGRGDMLVATAWDPFPIRMQGAYVSEEEVERAVEFVKTLGEPEYIDDEIFIDEEDEDSGPSLFGDEDDDPLYEKALEIVLQQGKASASYIQRRLKVGYNRASRLVELMEEKGIVGPARGSKPRDLMHNPDVLGRGAATAARQQSLIPDIETVPGQRVTGRDDPAEEE